MSQRTLTLGPILVVVKVKDGEWYTILYGCLPIFFWWTFVVASFGYRSGIRLALEFPSPVRLHGVGVVAPVARPTVAPSAPAAAAAAVVVVAVAVRMVAGARVDPAAADRRRRVPMTRAGS